MKTSWIAGLLIAGSLPLMAQNPNLGTAGATFLKIPTSAREAGLGQAAVSLMNGAEAVFVNPAGLASVKSVSVFAGYTPLWADVHVSHWEPPGILATGESWAFRPFSWAWMTWKSPLSLSNRVPDGTSGPPI